LCVGIHAAVFTRDKAGETRLCRLLVSNFEHSQCISGAKGLGVKELFIGLFLAPGDDIAGQAHHFAGRYLVCGRASPRIAQLIIPATNIVAAPAVRGGEIVIPATIMRVPTPAPAPGRRGDPRHRDTCALIATGQAVGAAGPPGGAARSEAVPLIKPRQ
jgi:hypothetical protein